MTIAIHADSGIGPRFAGAPARQAKVCSTPECLRWALSYCTACNTRWCAKCLLHLPTRCPKCEAPWGGTPPMGTAA